MRRATCSSRAEVRLRSLLRIVVLSFLVTPPAVAQPSRTLRVCADPNNLPFSSATSPGFENQIADVLAKELDAKVVYTWSAQRRGFFRTTLKSNAFDVVIGVPARFGLVRTTAPYYRSAYSFVSRADRGLDLRSLEDPRLRTQRIGVQLVGADGVNTPPAHALARRGIVDNVHGYSVIGDYGKDSPPADIVRAVADGTIDVAIVWGPLAGGFAKHAKTPLVVQPLAESWDSGLPMAFDIAVGVRHADRELAAELDRALVARRADIDRILTAWGVPRIAAHEREARR